MHLSYLIFILTFIFVFASVFVSVFVSDSSLSLLYLFSISSLSLLYIFYPLTAPAIMPLTSLSCMKMKRMIIGRTERVRQAMIMAVLEEYCP